MNKENKTPQWLVNIQENSWNVELFISIGFAFVLLKLPHLTENLSLYIITEYGAFVNFGILSWIIQLAVVVLPIGFITHLIFRGVWIGMVGFSYVFPEGIKSEKLDYPDKYKNIINKSKDPLKIIIRFEQICSLIYTFTFLFFFILIAVFNFVLVTGIILNTINIYLGYGITFVVFRTFFLFIGLVYALDFFTVGFLKRNKYTSKLFYPIYRILSFITLSKLYRTQYYTLITSFNKLKVSLTLFSALILYVFVYYISDIKTDKRILYSNTFHKEYLIATDNFYYNLIPEDKLINTACIQSDIITDDFLKLIICHQRLTEQIKYTPEQLNKISVRIDSLEKNGKIEATYQYVIDRYNELYKVYLDDSLVENIDWLFYLDSKTVAGGIICYLDISTIKRGHHQLKIKLIDDRQLANIHFWKE